MGRYILQVRIFIVALIFIGFAKGICLADEILNGTVESVYTDLNYEACRELIDETDPNHTPYRLCPGVSGYQLISRTVDSGRTSIEIVAPDKRIFPLDYQEFITRHMFHHGDKAEWRVMMRTGAKIPVALIVHVESHEGEDPAEVTHSYIAVAKITPEEICVTDRIPLTASSKMETRQMADSARDRQCIEPQPQW